MKQKHSPCLIGILQTLGVLVYCALVGTFLWYAGEYFSEAPQILGVTFMLFLLVISAGITGALVFGYPAYLALNKKLKEALSVLLYTLLSALIAGILLVTILFAIQK